MELGYSCYDVLRAELEQRNPRRETRRDRNEVKRKVRFVASFQNDEEMKGIVYQTKSTTDLSKSVLAVQQRTFSGRLQKCNGLV